MFGALTTQKNSCFVVVLSSADRWLVRTHLGFRDGVGDVLRLGKLHDRVVLTCKSSPPATTRDT